jgi:sugar/nucleoside kinase (ribokinase family)
VWDVAKDMRGFNEAVSAGAMSPHLVSVEMGTEFYKNIDMSKEAMEYAKAAGVPVSWVPSPATEPQKNEKLGDDDDETS